ncbi:AbrB/MazE/SpoVT family DNA-binding domain-containing protein [Kineococcus terrestris]|uniref:AbrB/MazE/SpoVT family DNA-binding domain-containing protein n=1 Tax=Kineococcus terrestris TaxID=2044856 RepID=UPI0034DAC657
MPSSYTVRLDAKRRPTLPAELLAAVDARPGSELVATVEDGRIVLETREALMERLRAKHAARPGEQDVPQVEDDDHGTTNTPDPLPAHVLTSDPAALAHQFDALYGGAHSAA